MQQVVAKEVYVPKPPRARAPKQAHKRALPLPDPSMPTGLAFRQIAWEQKPVAQVERVRIPLELAVLKTGDVFRGIAWSDEPQAVELTEKQKTRSVASMLGGFGWE